MLAEGDNRAKVFLISKWGFEWGEGIEHFKINGAWWLMPLVQRASALGSDC